MSKVANAAPLYMAERAADRLRDLLNPVCDRVVVAGSVRRGCEVVNDLEVCVVPKVEPMQDGSLWAVEVDLLSKLMDRVAAGRVKGLAKPAPREGRAAPWGERYKRLMLFDHGRWFAIDLFIGSVETWGALLAIRTGPALFSKLLVTRRSEGGAMPDGWRCKDLRIVTPDGPIDTPGEREFFLTLGLPVWDPRERSAARLNRWLQGRGP